MRQRGGASGKFTTTVWSFSSDVGDLLNSAGGSARTVIEGDDRAAHVVHFIAAVYIRGTWVL